MTEDEKENTLVDAFAGVATGILETVITCSCPPLAAAFKGWSNYQHANFQRQVNQAFTHLRNKVENLNELFSDEWFRSEMGQQFARKVFDCAFDVKLEEKQELFINALINGINDKTQTDLERLKFADMLKTLSKAALMILAEMHSLYSDLALRPGKARDGAIEPALVSSKNLIEKIGTKYEPFLIESCFAELDAVGLFSVNLAFRKNWSGDFVSEGNVTVGNALYTDFTCRFVEFISFKGSVG